MPNRPGQIAAHRSFEEHLREIIVAQGENGFGLSPGFAQIVFGTHALTRSPFPNSELIAFLVVIIQRGMRWLCTEPLAPVALQTHSTFEIVRNERLRRRTEHFSPEAG